MVDLMLNDFTTIFKEDAQNISQSTRKYIIITRHSGGILAYKILKAGTQDTFLPFACSCPGIDLPRSQSVPLSFYDGGGFLKGAFQV